MVEKSNTWRGEVMRQVGENRAKAIHQARRKQTDIPTMSKSKYWSTMVKNKDDVLQFLKLYHSEYPDELKLAIANRLETLVNKVNMGCTQDDLTEGDMELLTKRNQPDTVWDVEAEIEEQKILGQIALAEKRMAELLNDEDDKGS